MTTLAVLTKPWKRQPASPPERWPLGRAALALASEGIQVVFAGDVKQGEAIGQRATVGGWQEHRATVRGAWDRFPSQTLPKEHAVLVNELGSVPVGNPPALTLLCRDKVASQHALEAAGVRMPELEHRPEHLHAALQRWGAAFAKPQHGALGRGVYRVVHGSSVPSTREGAVPGSTDAVLLQRAVPLWGDYGGLSVRALVQRTENGAWLCCPPVARTHPTDPVANVARGATVMAAGDLFGNTVCSRITSLATQAATVLGQHPHALELGVDLVVDPDGLPWVIEVNGVPRGHLAALSALDPARWQEVHLQACCRPLRRLAALG